MNAGRRFRRLIHHILSWFRELLELIKKRNRPVKPIPPAVSAINPNRGAEMALDESLAELFEQYKDEVRETIGTLDSELVAVEQNPTDSEIIFSIFRHLHSLKGSSKMFNVDNIGHIAHKLEDVMQIIDQDNSILGRHSDIINMLFQGNDYFREIISRLESDIGYVNLTPDHARFIESINHKLEQIEQKEDGLLEAARVVLSELDDLLPMLEDIELEGLRRAKESLAVNVKLHGVEGESGGVRYTYSGIDLTDYLSIYANVLEKFKKGTFEQADTDTFFGNCEAMLNALFEVAEEEIMGVLGELNDGLDMYKERMLEIDGIVVEFLTMVFNDLKERVQIETDSGDEAAQPGSMDEEAVQEMVESRIEKMPAADQTKTIRVDERKIDLFLDSVGKLITQSEILNHLQFSFREAGINPALVRDFAAVNRAISNDIVLLQKSIMEVRQVEMNNILKKFPRLVRDVSHKMGKEVTLEIEGERVPIDKSLLDDVEQAMIHIIRNSIDHGLERPDEREAAGKSRRGRISIQVIQEEASILVEMADNGRGIDVDAVRSRAMERGMIGRDDYENLPDSKVLDLIFNSGLTTKAEATDISGRGVGLDVVLSNIKKWNGEVKMDNRPGQGLTFRLRIPITNTLLTKEAILLKLGDSLFCLPLEFVVEIVTVPTASLHKHKGHTVFQHRNQVISVIDLHGMLSISEMNGDGGGNKTCILLRGKMDNRKAIAADEIVGQQKIVIKDFDIASFRRLPYFQGLTLLGDGRVVLILNAEKIVE